MEFKNSIISMMMPPNNQSVSEIARETGLKEVTLYKWKREAKEKGFVVLTGKQNTEHGALEISSRLLLRPPP
jgi:transposase-like protein